MSRQSNVLVRALWELVLTMPQRSSARRCEANIDLPPKLLDLAPHLDWFAIGLGPPETWPDELKCTLQIISEARSPYFMAWGEELHSFWNAAYQPILAGRPAQMGQRFRDVWPEAWPIVGPLARAALNGKSSFCEDLPLWLHRDGKLVPTWWTFGYSPVRLSDGSPGGMLATLVEQTERVQLERRLQNKRDEVDRFLNLIPDLLWKSTGEGALTFTNRAMLDRLGIGDLAETDWAELVHPDDLPSVVARSARAREGRETFESRHRLRCAGGAYRWFLARANPTLEADTVVGWHGCATDIHEGHLVEERMRQSRDLLQQFTNCAAQLMWIGETEGVGFEFANSAALRFWRKLVGPDEEISGAAVLRLLSPSDQNLVLSELRQLRDGRSVRLKVDLQGRSETRQLSITAFPIVEPNGAVPRYGGIAEDCTVEVCRRVYLVAADCASLRSHSAVLTGQGFDVRGFTDIRAFARLAPALLPGCLLLVGSSDESWLLSAARSAQRCRQPMPTLALSGRDRDLDFVKQLMRLGVSDVLSLSGETEERCDSIEAALATLENDHNTAGGREAVASRIDSLSPRERQVLCRLSEGARNKVIGRELTISPRTVEAHRSRILEKLGVATTAEAISLAASIGLAAKNYVPNSR